MQLSVQLACTPRATSVAATPYNPRVVHADARTPFGALPRAPARHGPRDHRALPSGARAPLGLPDGFRLQPGFKGVFSAHHPRLFQSAPRSKIDIIPKMRFKNRLYEESKPKRGDALLTRCFSDGRGSISLMRSPPVIFCRKYQGSKHAFVSVNAGSRHFRHLFMQLLLSSK